MANPHFDIGLRSPRDMHRTFVASQHNTVTSGKFEQGRV